mgnify:CR=1 FL=1|jgi:hypothetical protein
MSSLNTLISATHVHDIDSDGDYVEIVYKTWSKKKREYTTFTDYLNTQPLGWTRIKCKADYYKFLDAMVVKTLEVRQRMAELQLEHTLYTGSQEPRFYVRLINATKILDPTFQPPRIDMDCDWQVDFITQFCKKSIHAAVQGCISKKRLEYFTSVMRTLTSEE